VTPLRDGMNLVAKEYVAAQDPKDPGVLVLSQFAGAARELDAALVVNPYDQSGVAAALDRALAMEHGERCERHAAMLHVMRRNSLDVWRDRFEADLRCTVDLPRCILAAEACCDPPEPVVSPTRPSYNSER
jgi:trehalose 6-phosphate synthase